MKSDIEIANETKLNDIKSIAEKIGLNKSNLICYGEKIAKVENVAIKKRGKVVLVTAVNPTPMGEGKTTVSIGLADGLRRIGTNASLALREPSLGPVFGVKGGATGGGYSQVAPMAEINLHFTGDIHAVTAANNLLSAMIDNSIFQGNPLNINPKRIVFTRCQDINDRALREIEFNAGTSKEPIYYKSGFVISAASEIMSILCLAKDLTDLKERLGNILVAFTHEGKPIFCRDLKAADAMAILLKEALKPNLVQTLEGTPAFIHGGPFANVAHGCNSVSATLTAATLSDIVVTEAGFGADLGAEKFVDIKCRAAGISPCAIVLVASLRALRFNGGASKEKAKDENIEFTKKGCDNIVAHIKNLKKTGVPVVVALNKFDSDSVGEINYVEQICQNEGVEFSVCECFKKGGEGAENLAKIVLELSNKDSKLNYYYDLNDPIETKIEKIAKNIYGAGSVEFSEIAKAKLNSLSDLALNLPVCIAKTQYSFSDDPQKIGRPSGFTFTVSDIEYRGGAGFVVAIAGSMLRMFGLPKVANAELMEIDGEGNIKGLY